jgi:hypothetical protein
MASSLKSLTLAVLLLVGLSGCRGPTELFSCVDRYCFIADCANEHTCVSCRYGCNRHSRPTVSKIREPIPAPAETSSYDGPALQ